jgi:hypothetical protein
MSLWVIGGLIFGAWALLSVMGYERERAAADAETLREMLAEAEGGAEPRKAGDDEDMIVVS